MLAPLGTRVRLSWKQVEVRVLGLLSELPLSECGLAGEGGVGRDEPLVFTREGQGSAPGGRDAGVGRPG